MPINANPRDLQGDLSAITGLQLTTNERFELARCTRKFIGGGSSRRRNGKPSYSGADRCPERIRTFFESKWIPRDQLSTIHNNADSFPLLDMSGWGGSTLRSAQ
jgi:hypothetical protein